MTNGGHVTSANEGLSRGQRGAVWVALINTLAMNAVASFFELNGNTPSSVSDRFEVFFTPAGYVFAIWSVIYLGLVAFAVYQTGANGEASVRIARLIGPFLLSCLANVSWIVSWHYELFRMSMICMLGLLASLLVIYSRLGADGHSVPLSERLSVRWPLRIYTAWICVATLANLSILVEAEHVRPFGMGAEPWALTMLVLASAVAVLVGLVRRDLVFLGVLAWAFVGIAIENGAGTPMFYAASSALALVGALVIYAAVREIRSHRATTGVERPTGSRSERSPHAALLGPRGSHV